jgi:2-keto-4-pentenoate hydratase/2-oxohepta-3-ene-1,7-dioic acid hydratase in catechol pathway
MAFALRGVGMKLMTVACEGRQRICAERALDGAWIDLSALAPSLLQLIDGGDQALEQARALLASPDAVIVPRAARILAPIPVPRRNILCVGKNYREHAKEFGKSGFDGGATGGDEIPEAPIIFSKLPSSVSAPGDPIPLAADPFQTVDYEGELAVVLARGGRGITAQDAMAHVFGYTIVNDVTAREVQKRHKQWLLGKSPDGFCPMGPAILSADAIADVTQLRVITHVNGEERQNAPVSDLIFSIPTLIEEISRAITLQPGDILATGTPAGVGIGFSPPRYLRSGDIVTVTIEPIGILQNTAR